MDSLRNTFYQDQILFETKKQNFQYIFLMDQSEEKILLHLNLYIPIVCFKSTIPINDTDFLIDSLYLFHLQDSFIWEDNDDIS